VRRFVIVPFALGTLLLPVASSAYSPTALGKARAVRTTTAVKAFDTTATITSASWFASAYRQGFRLYVLHSTAWGTCDTWSRTRAQLGLALAAGLKVAAYTRDPRCWREGIDAAGPYAARLQFFALDVETDPGVAVTQEMVDGVSAMGVRPVIYTGSGMWPGIMGSTTAFSGVPLWDTDTSKALSLRRWSPNLASPTPVQYAGWNTPTTMRKGVQQAFEVSLGGVRVDLSSFDASFLR
jgi:hypothetical protein